MPRLARFAPLALWAVTILLSLLFAASAIPKLAPGSSMVARFAAWGLPQWTIPTVGAAEAMGACLLLVPRTAPYGSAVLAAVMVGAIATHLRSGIGSPWFAAGCLALCVLVGLVRSRERRRREPARGLS